MVFRCPICKSSVKRDAEHFPFCCERCRQIDLGNWADGSYVVAGEPAYSDQMEEENGSV